MPFLKLVGFVFFIFLSFNALAKNKVFHYEPQKEELTGTLDIQTFPGLPNYESIAKGDEIERGFYLKLDHPIDVIATDKVSNSESEKNVRVVQLILSNGFWDQAQKLGREGHVILKGELWHQYTGHHHSRVLLEVERIRTAPKS